MIDPVVLWSGVWHLTDEFGRSSYPPLLTLCGREVPDNASVRERDPRDQLCNRCVTIEQSHEH